MRNILAVVIVALSASEGFADQLQCNSAASDYNYEVGLLSDALRDYAKCLKSTDGTYDCGREFDKLKDQQFRYKMASSGLAIMCR